ncbi:hypothetical protein [Methylobacterium sp. E-046]|uniref:hypothetical protein n=1 Tax=Methylobacterium sp. E-046 TaxID=2836576 RepID=UPI001FB895AD|nr:hypothetical protein [Methylobacterium sp. E-046]MCJ2097484.1 hypothetical protein [Methylobacterium sp. E-046]
MKINRTVRDIYAAAEEKYKRLSDEANVKLKPPVEERGWFFKSRVKALESFALKLETGRVDKPSEPEDFYACTIVVPTQLHVEQAEELVRSLYHVKTRRPERDGSTHKEASSFVFDDLRLYVLRGEGSSAINLDLEDLKFEIQIKTILQFAWGAATHDLIYKTDSVSWPKERIAYQVKAMLEHAELAISEASTLSRSSAVAKQDSRTADILKIIEQVERFWAADALPADRKRLAENIRAALSIAKIKAEDLFALLEGEQRRFGLVPRELSPYAFVVQALANTPSVDLEKKLRGSGRGKLLIHSGMELPAWMRSPHSRLIDLDAPTPVVDQSTPARAQADAAGDPPPVFDPAPPDGQRRSDAPMTADKNQTAPNLSDPEPSPEQQ